MDETSDPESPEASQQGVYREPHWVVLSEHDDRLDVAFIEDELTRAGIPSTTTRRLDDDRVTFRVMVARTDEARARAVVGASAAEPANSASTPSKSTRLVWGFALWPGCAHIYAGEAARGAVLLLALFSCFYWSQTDHMIVLAPFALYWVDALGARDVLQRRRAALWRIMAWTAPLWVATPAVLLRAAPEVYIGSAGRAVCASEQRCGVTMEGDCAAAMADQIGYSIRVRPALSACADFLDSRSCAEAYGDLDEDEICGNYPFCADAGTDGEAACISVYNGSVGWTSSEEPVPLDYTYHRGWGM